MGRRDTQLNRQTFTGVVAGFERRGNSDRLLVTDVRAESGEPFGVQVAIQVGNAIAALDLKRGEKIIFEGVPNSVPVWSKDGGRVLRNIPGATAVRRA